MQTNYKSGDVVDYNVTEYYFSMPQISVKRGTITDISGNTYIINKKEIYKKDIIGIANKQKPKFAIGNFITANINNTRKNGAITEIHPDYDDVKYTIKLDKSNKFYNDVDERHIYPKIAPNTVTLDIYSNYDNAILHDFINMIDKDFKSLFDSFQIQRSNTQVEITTINNMASVINYGNKTRMFGSNEEYIAKGYYVVDIDVSDNHRNNIIMSDTHTIIYLKKFVEGGIYNYINNNTIELSTNMIDKKSLPFLTIIQYIFTTYNNKPILFRFNFDHVLSSVNFEKIFLTEKVDTQGKTTHYCNMLKYVDMYDNIDSHTFGFISWFNKFKNNTDFKTKIVKFVLDSIL